ncbi:MAG: hypothetical protein JNJ54_34935 [Myxococcaceae bacterium]|nr:hypothetical protein [Myxococcaceae bacterium]
MSEAVKTWREWAADGSIAFWDCDDNREVLRFEELTEAIEWAVDDELSPGCDVEAVVREKFPEGLSVFGWERKEVTAQWLRWEAESLAERFSESFCEEFGGDDPLVSEEQEAELATAIAAALEGMRERLVPWQCEQVATVDLSLEELLELLRELCPSWFTTADQRPGGGT